MTKIPHKTNDNHSTSNVDDYTIYNTHLLSLPITISLNFIMITSKIHDKTDDNHSTETRFRLSIPSMDVTAKHYFPPSPPLRLLFSVHPRAKFVKGSWRLITDQHQSHFVCSSER